MKKISPYRRRAITTFILGAISSLAFAPTYYLFVLPVTFSLFLYFQTLSSSRKQAFSLGWCFGFGYFFAGLYWISNALLVDKSFAWLIPLSITLIPAILSLYIGLVTILIYPLRKEPLKLTLAFTSIWIFIEIARTSLFTGFPWLTLGYTLSPFHMLLQSARIWGVFGLSIIVLLVSLLPFVILFTPKRHIIIYSIIVSIFVFSNALYGYFKLKSEPTTFTDYSVLVVQPNISQKIKWDKNHRHKNLEKILTLSKTNANPNYIIWPEAAVPFILNEELRYHLKSIIPHNGFLITGGIRTTIEPQLEYWNALFILDHNGNIRSHYDKIHLVPFGEYVPMKNILPLEKIAYGVIDYSTGNSDNVIMTIKEHNLSFRPLICYESFFPTEILSRNQNPDLLINITNDAWYGNSPGPYQHFDITTLRAIEYGIPLIRAANTGISAIISPKGEIIQKVSLNTAGSIISNIPVKNKETFYKLYGNCSAIIFSLFLLMMTLLI